MNPAWSFEELEPRLLLDAATPTIDFSGGFDPLQMHLNGGAAVVEGDLRLTDTLTGQQSRSAYYVDKVAVDQFVTRFVYRATEVGPANTGGAVFVIQNQAPDAVAPSISTGTKLGYIGIEPSAAMAFTLTGTLRLYGDDADADLSIIKDEPLRPEIPPFASGHAYELCLSYDGDLLQLVTTDLDTADTYYLHYDVDIPDLLGGTEAWVGFSASTGSKEERRSVQEVESWSYYAGADELPPTAQFTLNGMSPNQSLEGNVLRAKAPYDVAVDAAESYDPDGSVVEYHWDFGDGTTLTTASLTATHQYAAPGSYVATLTVTDDDGNTSEPTTYHVVVSAALDAVLEPARTSGVAPLSVHFDATGTLGLSEADLLNARFAWEFDTTDADPAGEYETGEGFVATHVFEQPGTYVVRLTVTDTDGDTSAEEVTITVGDVDASWTTYYFASDGDDAAPGTMAQPKRTLSHALEELAGPNVRILLKKGDVWELTSRLELTADGPGIVDAYEDPATPSTEPPLLQATWQNSSFVLEMEGDDWRVMNLDVRGLGNGYDTVQDAGGVYLRGTRNLLYGANIRDVGSRATMMYGVEETIYSCTARHAGAYFVYGYPHQFAILGSDVEIESEHEEHVLRFQGAFQGYIAHNALRAKQTKSNVQLRGATSQIVMYDNDLYGRVSNVSPQNDDSEEYPHHAVWEANRFLYEPAYEGITGFQITGTAVGVNGRHVVIRSNLAVNYDRLFAAGGHVLTGESRDVHIYNNTVYSDNARGKNTGLLGTVYDAIGVVVRDNLVYSLVTTPPDSWVNAFSVPADIGDELTADHNLFYGTVWTDYDVFAPGNLGVSLAEWQALGYGTGTLSEQDPLLLSDDPDDPAFTKLSPNSPALDAGAPVPVWIDIDRIARPQGAAWDIGAFEAVPGDLTGNGAADAADVDLLQTLVRLPDGDPRYDLTGDGDLTQADVDELLRNILGSEYGDATLDGHVDAADLSLLAANWQTPSGMGWADGNFSGDGGVDAADLSLLAAYWQTGASAGAQAAAPGAPLAVGLVREATGETGSAKVAAPADDVAPTSAVRPATAPVLPSATEARRPAASQARRRVAEADGEVAADVLAELQPGVLLPDAAPGDGL